MSDRSVDAQTRAFPYALASPPLLPDADPELATALAAEAQRQEETIELIASENYVIRMVLEAQGEMA